MQLLRSYFKIIQLLGCEAEPESEPMPVLVILNKKGVSNVKLPYDPAEAERDFSNMELITYEVDFGKQDTVLTALPARVKELLCTRVDHLPLRFPSYWKEVREKLYLLREEKDHISLATYQEICENSGIEDLQQMSDLSKTLHELGVILHFQENDALSNTIVLSPEWAVNAIYEILNHQEVGKNQGRFDKDFLKRVWSDLGYGREERQFLRDLMLEDAFDVCFDAREDNQKVFIAPQLLPDHRPSFAWKAGPEALRYLYHYPFMPKGLIGRLIVHLNEKIQSQNGKKVIWIKGMLLEDKNGYEVLVEELKEQDTAKELIRITIIGGQAEDRRLMLREISGELDKIHVRSFPTLTYYELTPCCCSVCAGSESPAFFDRKVLDSAEKQKISHIQCTKSFEQVLVQRLKEGVDGQDRMGTRMFSDVRQLISNDKLGEALQVMEQACTDEDMMDDVLLLVARWNRLKGRVSRGSISSTVADTDKNKLIEDTLEVYYRMKE